MPAVTLDFVGDGGGAFLDLADRSADIIHLADEPIRIVALRGGMEGGRNSIMLRIDLPGGKVLLAETSVRVFLAAAAAITVWDAGQSTKAPAAPGGSGHG